MSRVRAKVRAELRVDGARQTANNTQQNPAMGQKPGTLVVHRKLKAVFSFLCSFPVFYVGVAATVTGRAAICGRTSSAGHTYTASRRE
jgi:hypothetical protein